MTHHKFLSIKALVMLAFAACLFAGSTAWAYLMKTGDGQLTQVTVASQPLAATAPVPPQELTAIDLWRNLRIVVPTFKFDFAALPDLKLSSLNVLRPALPGKGVFPDVGVDPVVAYNGPTAVEPPNVDAAVTNVITPWGGVVAAPPNGSGTPTVPPTGETAAPTTPPVPGGGMPSTPPSGSTGGSAAAEVNQANCAQFSAMPSAQFCSSIPDPNGQKLCSGCKAAGL